MNGDRSHLKQAFLELFVMGLLVLATFFATIFLVVVKGHILGVVLFVPLWFFVKRTDELARWIDIYRSQNGD